MPGQRSPRPPYSALSASAISRPPSETSWAQRSTPLPMESSIAAWRRRSASKLTVGGRPSSGAPSSRKYSLPASSSRVSPSRKTRSPSSWKPAGHLRGAAGVGVTPYTFLQLAEDQRPLRIPEVQAVRHRNRPRAGTDDVAGRFRDGGSRALIGVQRDVPQVAVGGQRQALVGTGHAQQRGVETGPDHGVVLHLVIECAVDGAPAA